MMIPSLISVLVFLSSNISIFQFNIVEVSAAPAIDDVKAMKYLAKYGYTQIAEKNINRHARNSKEGFTKALKEFQKFYNLKVTGKLDTQTVNQMQQPRCGIPDKFPEHLRTKRYELWGTRWNKKRIIFKILNTFENSTYQIPLSVVESDFSRALNLWQQYIAIDLQLSTKSGFDPDVSVSFQGIDGPRGILAHASLPTGSSTLMHFDGDEPWYFENGKYGSGNGWGVSFYQVATHEIGHTLGLDHSSDKNAVMYAFHTRAISDSNFRLHSDDIQGIQAQYRNMKSWDRRN